MRVFGSLARAQADERSGVDILVELEPGRTFLDLGGLQQELEALLGLRVDVVTVRGLKGQVEPIWVIQYDTELASKSLVLTSSAIRLS